MLDLEQKNILCVSAHLDDFEFGCGGMLSKYGQENNLFVLCMTANRKSYHGEVQEVREIEEQHRSMDILGIPKENLIVNHEIDGQMLPEYRQLVLETLYNAGKQFNPDLVLVPSMNDVHQDHRTVAWAALKAFKRKSVLGYQIFNSAMGFNPNLFLTISEKDLRRKAEAIGAYKSQQNPDITTADYFTYEIIRSIGISHGARVGSKFAEAFEIYTLLT